MSSLQMKNIQMENIQTYQLQMINLGGGGINYQTKIVTTIHSVPHNSNSLISNYRLFRRPPSAPKITPLTQC